MTDIKQIAATMRQTQAGRDRTVLRGAQDWPLTLTSQATGSSLAIPGIYQGANIARPVRLDEAATEGKSGKRRQAQGFEDAEVTISLLLIDDEAGTALIKLQQIEQLHTALDATGKPAVFTAVSPHLRARRIRQVLWTDLRSSETNNDTTILVDLVFAEYNPAVALAEDRAAPGANGAGLTPELKPPAVDGSPYSYEGGW